MLLKNNTLQTMKACNKTMKKSNTKDHIQKAIISYVFVIAIWFILVIEILK